MSGHLEVLRRVQLFGGLDDATLLQIAAEAEQITVARDEAICHRGEVGTHLFVVLTGRVGVMISDDDDDRPPTLLKTHGPCGFFGEMSLLTDSPISADVIASEETQLLRLGKSSFEAVYHRNPSVLLRLNQALARHLSATNIMVRPPRNSKLCAVHRVGEVLRDNYTALHVAGSAVRQTSKRVLLIDYGATLHGPLKRLGFTSDRDPMSALQPDRTLSALSDFRPYCVSLTERFDVLTFPQPLDQWSNAQAAQLQHLHAVVRRLYGTVLLDTGHEATDRAMKILTECDHVYLITSDRNNHAEIAQIVDNLNLSRWQTMSRLRVALVGPFETASRGTALGPLVKATGVKQAYLLNDRVVNQLNLDDERLPAVDSKDPMARQLASLGREVGGIRVGLALGSGGAKGFAHVGVMRVLEEAEIPVDVIVGCSMGAIVGACFAMGLDSHETEAMGHQLWARKGAFFDWQIPPWCNIVKGRKVDKMGDAGFGEKHFLDCPIPFAAMAFDLITGQEVVIDEGTLRNATRASGSMPGIMRPVKWRGKYLVDGGVANQVPVDVLSKMGADLNIAVNVAPEIDPGFYDLENPRRPGPLGCLMGLFGKGLREMYREPSIIQILARSFSTAAAKMTEAHLHLADVSLRPNTSGIGTLDFMKLSEATEIGQICAREHLDEIRDKLAVLRTH